METKNPPGNAMFSFTKVPGSDAEVEADWLSVRGEQRSASSHMPPWGDAEVLKHGPTKYWLSSVKNDLNKIISK